MGGKFALNFSNLILVLEFDDYNKNFFFIKKKVINFFSHNLELFCHFSDLSLFHWWKAVKKCFWRLCSPNVVIPTFQRPLIEEIFFPLFPVPSGRKSLYSWFVFEILRTSLFLSSGPKRDKTNKTLPVFKMFISGSEFPDCTDLIRRTSPFSIRNWCWPKPWGCSTSATSWSSRPACPRRSAATPRQVLRKWKWEKKKMRKWEFKFVFKDKNFNDLIDSSRKWRHENFYIFDPLSQSDVERLRAKLLGPLPKYCDVIYEGS